MKILYHHRTASKDGQAVHIEEMIKALRAEGHEVRVVAPTSNGLEEMGSKVGWVHRLKSALPRGLYELLELAYSLHAYRKLAAVAIEFKPDAIYERYNLFLLAGTMLRNKLGVPLLLEVNSPLVYERLQHSGGLALPWLARWAERKAWRSADYVLPVTRVLAGHIKEYGIPDSRIAVIPNGINKSHFVNAPSTLEAKSRLGLQDKLVLGFTGFIRDWHGVDRIINWMATPDAPANTHLLIVGDGPIRSDLETQALTLGIDKRITFTGVVNRAEVPKFVAAFDIALQPAVTSYASPLKLMEYLVLGKAIIAPATPNLLEILSDGKNAAMFDEEQPGSLQVTLTRLCRDGALRDQLATAAQQTIDDLQLTWTGNAQRVVTLAQATISGSRKNQRK
jgi:glycosyltransferase involved in cell wall biosynthesis